MRNVQLALGWLLLCACGDDPRETADAAVPRGDERDAEGPRDSGDMPGERWDASAQDGSFEGTPLDASHDASDDASDVESSDATADDSDGGTDGCRDAVATALLIMFDESLSMNEPWQGTTRLEVVKNGARAAVATLSDSTSIGALFFPTSACVVLAPPPPGGAVAPIELSPQIGFRPAGAFVAAWDSKWAAGPNPNAGLSTPFQEAFDRADTALATAAQSAAVTKVVLLTDGESGNCFPDGDGTMTAPAPWPTDTAAHRVEAWVAAGVTMRVIALPGANPVELAPLEAATGVQTITPIDAAGVAAAIEAFVVDDACP